MSSSPKQTPAQILNERVAAHAVSDYTMIYHSTHSASAFRANFLTLDDYLEYAQDHLVDTIRIEAFAIEFVQEVDPSTYVTARAKYISQQETNFVFEQHELQIEDGQWRLLASCRLSVPESLYQQEAINPDCFTGQPWF